VRAQALYFGFRSLLLAAPFANAVLPAVAGVIQSANQEIGVPGFQPIWVVPSVRR
jgi:hypothetical protein